MYPDSKTLVLHVGHVNLGIKTSVWFTSSSIVFSAEVLSDESDIRLLGSVRYSQTLVCLFFLATEIMWSLTVE